MPSPVQDASRRRRTALAQSLVVAFVLGATAAIAGLGSSPARAGVDRPNSAADAPGVSREGEPPIVRRAPLMAPDRLIVRFRDGVGAGARETVRSQMGLQRVRDLASVGAEVVTIARGSPEAAAAALERLPEIEFAEPDYVRTIDYDYGAEPGFGELWGLHNTGQTIRGYAGVPDVDINGLEASAITLGDPNVVVAVIDDGVDFSHPDLAGREWVNPGESGGGRETNRIDDDGNGYVDDVNGWDFCNNDNTVHDLDDDFHGTHVAATIAGSLNGQGIVGVAPNVKIMALKFLGDACGRVSQEIDAIEYALSQGVTIANASYGHSGYSDAERSAIANADLTGNMLFVAAAGNSAVNNDTDPDRSYPASYDLPNIVSVAALTNDGYLAWFSNYGPTSVDLVAPGVDVLSAVPRTSTRPAGWGWLDGTSMAAPHVTGAAALAASVDGEMRVSPRLVRIFLMEGGKVVADTVGATASGRLLDARRTLEIVLDAAAPSGTVTINGNATYTNRTTVSLAIPASDGRAGSGVTQMQLSNDTANVGQYNYSSPVNWSLSESAGGSTANGVRTVYARWGDLRGNWSEWAADTIVLDTVAPSGTVNINASAPITYGPWVRVGLSGTDNVSGVGEVRLSNSPATTNGVLTYGYTYANSASVVWSVANTAYGGSTTTGTKAVYAQWRDRAGNWSPVSSDTISYVADAANACAGATAARSLNVWHYEEIFPSNDVDWFRFQTSVSQYALITLGRPPADYRLDLYNSSCALVASSNAAGTGFEQIYRHLPAGTYFLRVAPTVTTAYSTTTYAIRFQSLVEAVQVLSASSWADTAGRLGIAGEVLNNTPSHQRAVKITATFFNSGNQAIASVYSYTHLDTVAARSRSPFELAAPLPADYHHYRLTVSSVATTIAPLPGFAVTSAAPYTDAAGYRHYTGQITNRNTFAVRDVKAVVTLYNAFANVVNAGAAPGEPSGLAPGATATFDIATNRFAGTTQEVIRVQAQR